MAAAGAQRAAAQHGGAGESFEAAERAILAGREPNPSGITLDLPILSENGNSVDLAIRVASPSTPEDHVTAIHVLAERNPYPRVASFGLSARAGRAEVATRIRLATSQTILVLAETSRGQVHRATREVVVILGACVEGG
jgi:sulfur-oxidizing protein SoxY